LFDTAWEQQPNTSFDFLSPALLCEEEILEHALTKSFHPRNEAIKSLILALEMAVGTVAMLAQSWQSSLELMAPCKQASLVTFLSHERTFDNDQQDEQLIHGACTPSGRLFESILGGFDGGVICFRVYLEQHALALKLTKPALQLLVVHALKRTKQLLASHWLVLLNPRQQLGLSALFHSFLAFACVTSKGHSAALEKLPSAW
jgi:hypothetical protein